MASAARFTHNNTYRKSRFYGKSNTHTPGPWNIYEGLSNGPRKYIGYENTGDSQGAPHAIARIDIHKQSGGSDANTKQGKAMRYKARYIPTKKAPEGALEYWRTIDADSINEAVNAAEKYTRKGYIMTGVSTQLFSD